MCVWLNELCDFPSSFLCVRLSFICTDLLEHFTLLLSYCTWMMRKWHGTIVLCELMHKATRSDTTMSRYLSLSLLLCVSVVGVSAFKVVNFCVASFPLHTPFSSVCSWFPFQQRSIQSILFLSRFAHVGSTTHYCGGGGFEKVDKETIYFFTNEIISIKRHTHTSMRT